MVIALRAELQNILYSLKYEKLDKSIDEIKEITSKYLSIVGSGNQSILSTLTKFIGEIEYLFINAAKIEYNYYVKYVKVNCSLNTVADYRGIIKNHIKPKLGSYKLKSVSPSILQEL